MNARALDLGAPDDTLQGLAGDDALRWLLAMRTFRNALTAAFQAGGAERLDQGAVLAIASFLAITTHPNAGSFVFPPGARALQELPSRLARVGLKTRTWFDAL